MGGATAVLAGLVLNATAGWWWADPLAGLVIVHYGLREARHAWAAHWCGGTRQGRQSRSDGAVMDVAPKGAWTAALQWTGDGVVGFFVVGFGVLVW